MTRFTWNPKLATGIASIDAQHISLFESAKYLHQTFRDQTASEGIAHTLNHLVAYCATHFEDEEGYMIQRSFPRLHEHQAEHRKLMSRVFHLRDRYVAGETSVAMDLSILIADWLRDHILKFDQAFAEYVRQADR